MKIRPYAYALLLFGLNVSIAWRLFSTEYTRYTHSNEGTFIAIARFIVERWPHIAWYPLWFNGIPFENTYSPVLQLLDAAFAGLTHTSTALAFHAVMAFFYCLGPVLLFIMAWKMSGALHPSMLAALLWSLTSPSVIFPAVRGDAGGWHVARRLHTLVFYGEGAHNAALSLLPLAILCAWLALNQHRFRWYAGTACLAGALVLTNSFAAVDLVLAGVCLIAVQPRGRRLRGVAGLAAAGLAAYLWISPLMTPSLIATIRANSLRVEGDYRYTPATWVAAVLFCAGGVGVWYCARRAREFSRFCALFAYVFTAIPTLAQFHIYLLPQAARYHLEMEMAACLALALAASALLRASPRQVACAAIAILACGLLWQFTIFRRYARALIVPIDITTTIEYQTAKWMEGHLPGLRTMVSGDVGLWFNAFTDNPQLGSGHDPFSPNWMVEHVTYQIYSSEGAGPRAAAIAITWLKAFGCHAVTVHGPSSREHYKPFRNPRKFDAALPVLWRQGDDVIYGIPQRSTSLAHVIPAGAVIDTPPVNSIDTAQVERFAAALDDTALPLAPLSWTNPSSARISAFIQPGQVLALQETYDPGWKATANASPAQITRDGIGLMTIHPGCNGPCEIQLTFDGGAERKICWAASLIAMAAAALISGKFRS